ncbi:sensor histidine kinase [Antrihabitans cavernicola]|nr:sensor histidine kinase [Spelaeibacter cavernicola]
MIVASEPGLDDRNNDRRPLWKVAEWPLRWKVAAVLTVPLILAGTFGGLRVQSQLSQAAQLSAAADHVAIVAPAVAVSDATEGLALAAVSGTNSGPAVAAFDAATAALNAPSKRLDPSAAADLASAVGMAASLRNDVGTVPVPAAKVTERVNSVSQNIAAAISSAMSGIDDRSVDTQLDRLRATLDARRALEMQRILIAAPDAQTDPVARAGVVAATGSEVAVLDQLAAMDGTSPDDIKALRNEASTRRAAFTDAVNPDPVANLDPAADAQKSQGANASGKASADRYQRMTNDFVTQLDDSVHAGATSLRSSALRDTAIVLGAVLAAFVLALLVAASLIDPIRKLRLGALQVARRGLPQEIERIRDGKPLSPITPIGVHSHDEMGQLARAVDDIHGQAVRLAGEQASLRVQIGDMFETLSRRSRTLVEKQLALIEKLELDEDDPQRLESLFQLDHLATRMRRNGDNLLVLSGTAPPKDSFEPIPLADVLRGALSEVEDYQRVEIGGAPDGALSGNDAADVVHLAAELIDNALRYSPPESPVSVTAARAVDGGYLIDIADSGIGMHDEDLQAANGRLASGGEVTPDTARRMGLFVVGRLATRHGITVRLRPTNIGAPRPGVTASVHIPATSIVPVKSKLARPTGAGAAVNGSSVNSSSTNGSEATDAQPSAARPASIGTRRAATRNGSSPVRSAPQPQDDQPVGEPKTSETTPIFQRMASEWLLDPNAPKTGAANNQRWASAADAGWNAARSASAAGTGPRTASGLPQRRPGARLVPGGAASAPGTSPKPQSNPGAGKQSASPIRNAEAIRAALNDHVSGVRDGRTRVGEKRDRNEGAR